MTVRTEPSIMPIERRRVFYRGNVQGVGFRATVRRLALGYAVAGTVRNLDDGRVELVAEGEPAGLDRLQEAIAREFATHVRGVDAVADPPGDEPLTGFRIL